MNHLTIGERGWGTFRVYTPESITICPWSWKIDVGVPTLHVGMERQRAVVSRAEIAFHKEGCYHYQLAAAICRSSTILALLYTARRNHFAMYSFVIGDSLDIPGRAPSNECCTCSRRYYIRLPRDFRSPPRAHTIVLPRQTRVHDGACVVHSRYSLLYCS